MQDRYHFIDALRGVAVLGILIMNVQSFGMISEAYINPLSQGVLATWDQWAWAAGRVLADSKFIAIFSLLFGAGLALQADRIEASGRRDAASVHLKRMFWLGVFGIIHGTLIWHGDILSSYVICGLFVFWLRKLDPEVLFVIALVLLLPPVLLMHQEQLWVLSLSAQDLAYFTAAHWQPSAQQIAAEVAAYQGDWQTQLAARLKEYEFLLSYMLPNLHFWKSSALMLMGMALYRCGYLQGKTHILWDKLLAFIGLLLGTALCLWGLYQDFQQGWLLSWSLYTGRIYLYVSGILTALGFVAILKLLWSIRIGSQLLSVFIPVGRIAFTNYILQSLICTYLFYGHGLGWFGTMGYADLWFVILPIWCAQMVLSYLYLKVFRYGPLEWLWRSLVEGKPYMFLKRTVAV